MRRGFVREVFGVRAGDRGLHFALDPRTRKNGKIRKRDPFSDFSQGACVEQRENLKEEINRIPPYNTLF